MALNLTRGGAKCLLLEAGRHFLKNQFPANEMLYSSQMFWNGGLEVSAEGQLGLLRGKCVGGTTVVNQALVDRFDEGVFSDWRNRTGIDSFESHSMAENYEAVEKELEIRSIPPEFYNQNAKIFTKGFDDLGYFWSPLRRAQKDCRFEEGSDCIVCLGGCPRESKQSTLVTSIPRALELGLTLLSETEVYALNPKKDEIHVQAIHQGEKKVFRAKKTVLAAGALGNFPILARSNFSDPIPALGKNFSCHPQFMSFGLFDHPVDAHKGPLQSVKSDDQKLKRAGFKFENVFAPPIGTAMLIPGFGRKHQKKIAQYRYLGSIEVCVKDEPVGELRLDKHSRVRVNKPLTNQDRQRMNHGLLLIREMFFAAGAKDVFTSTQGFGLHLMGGCSIGVDSGKAVVDPEFRLFADRRVIIADSSVFPSAPGINPSLTIMALSEKASQGALQ